MTEHTEAAGGAPSDLAARSLRARLLGHSPQTFAIGPRQVQRANGSSSEEESEEELAVVAMDLGEPEEDLERSALEAWDAAVEQARGVALAEHGVHVSAEEVEAHFGGYGVENPRDHDFELDSQEEFVAYLTELGSAIESYLEDVETRQSVPTEAYERYAEKYAKRYPEKEALDPERLKQNTTAFAQFLQQTGLTVPVMLAQRSYPGMEELAAEHGAALHTAPGNLLKIHAEMLGLYLQMQSLVEHGLVNVMLHVHPSQPVCFFCEIMMRLFDVAYDPEFVDKRMFPGWIDPSGYFEDRERGYLTPRLMLEMFGYDVEAAAARVLPLFGDVADPKSFVTRILAGELQSPDLKTMIRDLKAASPSLKEANAKAKGASGGRKPSKSTKAGRKALREQSTRARERRKQEEERGRVDYPVEGVPERENRAQWRRYLEQISVIKHEGNQLAATIIEEINLHPEQANEILDRLRLGPKGAILGYLRGG